MRRCSRALQRDLILGALTAGRVLTESAIRQQWGCYDVPRRIRELRKAGHKIVAEVALSPQGEHGETRYRMAPQTTPL